MADLVDIVVELAWPDGFARRWKCSACGKRFEWKSHGRDHVATCTSRSTGDTT